MEKLVKKKAYSRIHKLKLPKKREAFKKRFVFANVLVMDEIGYYNTF